MKILVLNCGSSSAKFQFIETDAERIERNEDRLLAKGQVEKIGTAEAIVSCVSGERQRRDIIEILDHHAAIQKILASLEEMEVVKTAAEIEAIGHRVVHGGEFRSSQLFTDPILKEIESATALAPLHNPHNLKGYFVCRELFLDIPQVAVFDTAFHQTMPPRAFLYALPYHLYKRNHIRRYGFHGTSHRYVAYRFRQITGRSREDVNLITCHLGNGCSITAIQHGHSVDTSMGFTPLEGLVMGTRSGDLDPAILLHLMAKEEMTMHEVSSLLNRHSGLFGLSGESNDMRELLGSARRGHERAQLAIEVFCYRLRKYIGGYLVVLGRVDALIFTGGIGENAPRVRQLACEYLSNSGLELDPERNEKAVGIEAEISTLRSPGRIYVIPTNEELLIARDTYRTILGIPHP